MRKHILGFTALALGTVTVPAIAQDAAPAAAPASPFTISGGATIVSDYRFRGLSQTDKHFAIQGTIGVAHSSGFYVGTWGSSVDDYITNGSNPELNGGDQEIDLYGGWKKTINGTTIDVGLLYYWYPGSHGVNSDFFEPYASVSKTFGPFSAKLGANYAWKQHGLADEHARDDNLYGYGELSATIPNTGFSITGHLGHNFERSYITFGRRYSDWNVTGAYAWKNLTFSVAYVDTSINAYPYSAVEAEAVTPEVSSSSHYGKNIAKAGVVASIGVAF